MARSLLSVVVNANTFASAPTSFWIALEWWSEPSQGQYFPHAALSRCAGPKSLKLGPHIARNINIKKSNEKTPSAEVLAGCLPVVILFPGGSWWRLQRGRSHLVRSCVQLLRSKIHEHWLVVWNIHFSIFPNILGMSSSQLYFPYIFHRFP